MKKTTKNIFSGQERKRRRLNDDAIPTKFPGVPSYLSRTLPKKRSENSTSAGRLKQEGQRLEASIKQFLNEDRVEKFEDLLSAKHEFPSSWKITSWESTDKIVLEEITFDEEEKPKFDYSLTIYRSLNFCLVKNDTVLSSAKVSKTFKESKIQRFSDVANILAYLRADSSQEQKKKDSIDACISLLEKILEAEDEDSGDYPKLSFLKTQLCLISTPVSSRRYIKLSDVLVYS